MPNSKTSKGLFYLIYFYTSISIVYKECCWNIIVQSSSLLLCINTTITHMDVNNILFLNIQGREKDNDKERQKDMGDRKTNRNTARLRKAERQWETERLRETETLRDTER